MDITLCEEQAYFCVPQVSLEVAQDRVEHKKAQLLAGTVGAILSRPKPEEIQMVSLENRLEPFWLVRISGRVVYDRVVTYPVTVGGSDVQTVELFGQQLIPEVKGKEGPRLTLNAIEHCRDERQAQQTFDALTGEAKDLHKYLPFAKTVITDLDQFTPNGILVIPPQVRASAVTRQVMVDVIKPVQNANTIYEEVVSVEALELNFRPVYAFEYEWAAKGKRAIIEFDGLTGETNLGGRKMREQVKQFMTKDLLFDVTADAVGLIIPGGSIAVKLVKAVVDKGHEGRS
jgi:hypothetical protein